MRNLKLKAALDYHARGWSLLPIKPGTKEPAIRAWKCFQTAAPTPAMVRDWFGRGERGVAIVAGDVSGGLVVRDFDCLDRYEQWAAAQPALAKSLPTVETVRGRHVYARGSVEAVRKLSKSGEGAILDFGDGELRAGGYCLAPPSMHPSGKAYKWVVPLAGELPILDVVQAGFVPESWRPAQLQSESNPLFIIPPARPSCSPCDTEGTECAEGAADTDHSGKHSEPKTFNCDRKKAIGKRTEPAPTFVVDGATEQAIRGTLPSGPGQRHRHIFELARALKAIPALADSDAKALRGIVQQWHKLALPAISTKPFDDTWFDFLEGWGRVKYAKGSEPMAKIFAKAVEAIAPAEAVQYEQPKLRLLVALCRELQREAGGGAFFLSARTAARLLDIDHATAARWLRGLRHDGILQLIEQSNRTERLANSYRYLPAL